MPWPKNKVMNKLKIDEGGEKEIDLLRLPVQFLRFSRHNYSQKTNDFLAGSVAGRGEAMALWSLYLPLYKEVRN